LAADATLDLSVAPNLVTLRHATARLSGGQISGEATLRRDNRQATLEGKIAVDHVGLRLPAFDTIMTGALDFAGAGTSPSALVASLGGSGAATAADLHVPGAEPGALPKIFQDVENDVLTVDEDAVTRAFADAAKGPLAAGTRRFNLGLAAGTLHADPDGASPQDAAGVTSKIGLDCDLTRPRLDMRVEETLHALPKNWEGPPPSIVVTLAGPPSRADRSFDVSAFLNAVAARALAREAARIETYEFDIRERAIFNARLVSERRREEERQKAEDDARKAEIDRQARVLAAQKEAARLERLRREQAIRAAQEKAAQAKADQERAAEDRAAKERAARDEAAKAARDRARREAPPEGPQTNEPPPAASDPSAFGRY
jgi:hypothetical protein